MSKRQQSGKPLITPDGYEISVQVVEREGGPQTTITIPRPIAQALRLRKRDTLAMTIENGNIKLRKN